MSHTSFEKKEYSIFSKLLSVIDIWKLCFISHFLNEMKCFEMLPIVGTKIKLLFNFYLR